MIALKDVTAVIESELVLKSINLKLAKGKVHVLLGPPDAGKTTLIKVILGVWPFISGSIQIDDLELTDQTQSQVARLMGYVPSDCLLFPHLTARDNASMVANRGLGWLKYKVQARLTELCDLFSFEESHLTFYPSELKPDERVKISFIRALITDPPILIVDDPFTPVNPYPKLDLQKRFRSLLGQTNKTVLFATSDVPLVHELADHVIFLDRGQVIQIGRLSEMVQSPEVPFVREFIRMQKAGLGQGRG